jgi:hypothetical protein
MSTGPGNGLRRSLNDFVMGSSRLAMENLCEFCASFDPADVKPNLPISMTISGAKYKDYRWYSMDFRLYGYSLRKYDEMTSSANDGCQCCSFFLSLIRSELPAATALPAETELFLRDRSTEPYEMFLSAKLPAPRGSLGPREDLQQIIEVKVQVCSLNSKVKDLMLDLTKDNESMVRKRRVIIPTAKTLLLGAAEVRSEQRRRQTSTCQSLAKGMLRSH